MRLTIVGSAGSLSGPESAASCYLVEAEAAGRTWRLVLDLGSGAIGPLQRYCDPATVDGIVVSHGHPDHMADLAAFSVLRRYGPTMDQGLARTPLLGPRGIDQRILAVSGAETDDYTDLSVFDFTAVQQFARISLGPFDISVAKAWHPVPAVGYRIEGPGEAGGRATLVYTGDTDRCAEQDALATGADVLLAEAGWAHREVNPEGVHMNGTQAGAMAAEAGVGRLVLTHVASWVNPAPTLAQAKQAFAATQLATPGLVVRL